MSFWTEVFAIFVALALFDIAQVVLEFIWEHVIKAFDKW